MDHDDALTKLEEVPEGEGEPPGQLFDAGEGLDPWVSPAATLLLSLQTNKQLWKEKEITSAPRSYQSLAAAYVFRGSVGKPYLLQAEHQCTSTLDLICLSGPVHGLFDDVSKVVVVLRTNRIEEAPSRYL